MMNISGQEHSTAQRYKTSKELPFRKYVEEFTIFQLLGFIEDKSILDLACGEGFYTRKFKQTGADKVLGVDISREMIHLAEQQEIEQPLNCFYEHADASQLTIHEEFDLVTGIYLLNFAQDRNQLLNFCTVAYNALKPGGSFVGFNDNVDENPNLARSFAKYGFEKTTPNPQREGDEVLYTITNEDRTELIIKNFFIKPENYKWAFEQAGFSSFTWEGPFLHPSERKNSFWSDFMHFKPMIGFRADK